MLLLDSRKTGSDAGYQPGDNMRQSYQPVDPQADNDSYPSVNAGQSTEPNDDSDSYASQNQENFSNPEFQNRDQDAKAQDKARLIDQAKRVINRGRATAQRTFPKQIGSALGDKQLFMEDTEENRERAKEKAKEKLQEKAREQINKRVKDKGFKQGFDKGLGKNIREVAKEVKGAAKAARAAKNAKTAATAAKGAKTAATAAKGVKTAATAVKGAQAVITAAGAASGPETLGIGFLVSILLNIAISLGVSDAIDALFEIKNGDFKKARFLAVRAAAKVGMFIVLLISLGLIFSIGGIIIGGPILFLLNLYMIGGLVFKNFAPLQGFVWWERAIIIYIDIMAFLIFIAFLAALGWYLCTTTGTGTSGIQGAVVGVILSAYDWWSSSSLGSVAADFCKYVNTTTAQ